MKHYILYDQQGKILQNISSSIEQPNQPLLGNYLLEVSSPIPDINLKKVVNGKIVDTGTEETNTFTYDYNRYLEYPILREQLGMLWHDIDQGLFGETAKQGSFYTTILNIKTKLPKPQ
jgi:hypothetical protein